MKDKKVVLTTPDWVRDIKDDNIAGAIVGLLFGWAWDGKTKEIPNLRDKSIREQWRNHTACTDPKTAGDMLLPTFSKGTPKIDASVYEKMKNLWEEECSKEDSDYRKAAFNQGSGKK